MRSSLHQLRPSGGGWITTARGRDRLYTAIGVAFIMSFVMFELATHNSLMVAPPPAPVAHLPPKTVQLPSPSPIRGLSPDRRALFDLKGFICASTREQVPAHRINDNYCDCPGDGSDEPGTSACANGRFWCAGEKHYLPSSLVDDNICDCCDGSDELVRQCPNTCDTYHDTPANDPYFPPPHEGKVHTGTGLSLVMIGVWVFILCHLFAILGGLWYLASPRRDHFL